MAERSTATQCARGRTLGADKNYDTADSVTQCRARKITPRVVQNTRRTGGSAIDARTSRHAGYEISQFKRQMAERIHALPQTWPTTHRAMVRGLDRMNAHYQLALAGGNLVRSVTSTAQVRPPLSMCRRNTARTHREGQIRRKTTHHLLSITRKNETADKIMRISINF